MKAAELRNISGLMKRCDSINSSQDDYAAAPRAYVKWHVLLGARGTSYGAQGPTSY